MGKGEILGFLMQGASPLASPGLNPGGTGAGGAILRRAGGLPQRCRITLPSLSPMGGAAVWVAGFTSHITRFSPHPPNPLPGGKGEFFGLFRRGLPPPAPLRLNPGDTGAGAAYHAPSGGARAERGRFVTGRGANAGLRQQFIREKFLGVWGLLSRSPRTLPCPGARRGRFVMGRARTPDCSSNSFGKSSWGFGGFFQEAPNVSSYLRIFSVIPHLRSADSMT